MIHPRYLAALLLGVFLWVAVYFGVTLFVDPFGVSPLRLSIARVNEFKPRRLDIDRLIKPYEVWRYQPKTVFLGTSRIHQSLDPAALDGTRFAPAYNASIPASSLGLNISHLQQYVEFDPQLRSVVVELFLYNFLGQGQEHSPKDYYEYLRNSLGLFISADALWAALQTVGYNLTKSRPAYEIKPGGYYYYPPGHNAQSPFAGFPAGIWKLHDERPDGMKLHEPAMDAVRTIIDLCRRHGLELIFVLSPNHAYDDYYVDAIDAWPTVEEWLGRLSRLDATIYSFSQPNPWVYEPVSERMRYWNDPYHFSLEMGGAMLRTLAGIRSEGVPHNFAQRLTPDNVAAQVESRRVAVREWAKANPEFVAAFHEEWRLWESLYALASLRKALVRLHPGASITAHREVTGELLAANAAQAHRVKGGRLENPWGGRLVAQIFPPNAWGPGVLATHNYYLEAVPRKECSRLVEALARGGQGKVFRINLEPSGKVHSRFPITGADGCRDGKNTVGYTEFAG
jgi:hypothetical protein